MIRVDTPEFTAVVHKRIQRGSDGISKRFAGARRALDLTPFLGDGCSIETNKDIRQPSGAFTITIVDQQDSRDGGISDTLYGFVEPMDYVEIRGARRPHEYVGRDLPIIMRGWITQVQRHEAMGADGRPVRRVIIAGQDYGKIAQMNQLLLSYMYSPGERYLTSQRLFAALTVPMFMHATTFIATVVDTLINPFLEEMAITASGRIPIFNVDSTVTDGEVATIQSQLHDDSAWTLMTTYADLDWNELFVEDRETQPCFVYRPIPFYDAAGAISGLPLTIDGNPLPMNDALDIADVISMRLSRSDANVASFYWVEMPIFDLTGQNGVELRSSLALSTISDNDDSVTAGAGTNSDPALYGQRKLEARGQQLKFGAHAATQDWLKGRREQLRKLNIDNVVWEEGAMDAKGNEKIRPGRYLPLRRGDFSALYYVRAVNHKYVPFHGYTTSLLVDRGTGFLERRRRERSPHAAESQLGPYQ
jgi:hypothetical protein